MVPTTPPPPSSPAPSLAAPPACAPADPRPGEVADEVRRATTWLADVDLEQLRDGDLLGLVETLTPVLDRLTITVALALGRAEARDATIDADGLLPDAWLRMVCRRTGADRRTLLCAGQVLPTLPRLCEAAIAGLVSWSEVRVICLAAARLSSDDRRQLDLHLAADRDALQDMTPAEVLELLDHVLAELHPAQLEDRETREFNSQFVAFRPRLDGTGQIFGDLDSLAFTDVAGRVGQLADQLPSPPDRPDEPRWRSKGHRQALALHRLIAADADDRPGTSAQLLVTVDDLAGTPDDGPGDTGGTTDERQPRATLHHRRGARAMSPAQLLRLAALAEVRTLLTSGGVPLQVGRSRRRATRAQRHAAAVLWRGCAWPGCDAPPVACDLHHVRPWDPDGRTDDTNLVPLCPVHHHAVTHDGWTLRLHPDRTVEVQRGRRRLRRTPPAVRAHRSRAGPASPRGVGSAPP